MIIIEKTNGMSNADIRKLISADLDFISEHLEDTNDVDIWFHKEKEGREVILNTDDHPLLPGHTSFEEYEESGMNLNLIILCPYAIMDDIYAELGI